MNRIYQGKVTDVSLIQENAGNIPNEDDLQPLKNWDRHIWDFHSLFQDAVNYYMVCLMAMAHETSNPIYKIKTRINGPHQEHNVWKPFNRKSNRRLGMCEVAKYFGLIPEEATLEQCCARAIEGNTASPQLLDRALSAFLKTKEFKTGNVRDASKNIELFVLREHNKNYPYNPGPLKLEWAKKKLPFWLFDPERSNDPIELAAFLEPEYFSKLNASKPYLHGAEAREAIIKRINEYSYENQGILQKDTLLECCEQLDDTFYLPNPAPGALKGGAQKRFSAYCFFKYLNSSEASLQELQSCFTPPTESAVEKFKDEAFVGSDFLWENKDPIQAARDERGFIFPAFTALAEWGAFQPGKWVWKDFDINAFGEALKAFHQVETKAKEREGEKAKLQTILEYMNTGKGAKQIERLQEGDESVDVPVVFKGDSRMELIEKLHKSLRKAYEASEEEESEYGLRERTIRGFDKLAKAWKRLNLSTLTKEAAVNLLIQKLNEVQSSEARTFGSADLFRKLTEPAYWEIWQNSFEETLNSVFAENPLEAYVYKLRIEDEIKHLDEPIRFTPADPHFSRRQYSFGDKQTFKNTKGKYHHETNELAVVVGFALRREQVWQKSRVKLSYSAPRFLRDGLRSDDENLNAAPWQQPMMEALGFDTGVPQDIHNFPVFLMPKWPRDGDVVVNLNFPLTLDESTIVSKLGKQAAWNRQFAGGKDKSIYLRWPNDEWPSGWEEKAWYHGLKPFRLISVDLGVRDAGALALIECRPNKDFALTSRGTQRQSRYIGEAGGHQWHAATIRTKMLRLPGEDALVRRNGELKQEFSGEKGRLADAFETNQAKDILVQLGYPDLLEFKTSEVRFFAYQNERLLLGLRWSQKRLARWQTWSWMLTKESKAEIAKESLKSDRDISPELKKYVDDMKWPQASVQLNADIEDLKKLLSELLEQIANRVVPLRGRSWRWQKRDDDKGYILLQAERGSDSGPKRRIAGQRGLSIERLEMIEDFRKRCQSLNRALRHIPGTKPKKGFETRGDDGADPCPDILDKLDRMRKQRVNQTSQMILAEALGLQLRAHEKSKGLRKQRDIHGEYEKVREPVDFIVLEDLNRYLTSQGRSKQENSRLMKWCHRAILSKLKQLSETYGLPVLEVSAAYSSRFSAKDGTPGFRAKEVSINDQSKYPWKKLIEKGDADALELFRTLDLISDGQSDDKPRTLIAPSSGGPIFVPMEGNPSQADINAAINIGLRAVAAPDILDVHHKIRTEADGEGSLRPLVRSKREKARWGSDPASFQFNESFKPERNSNCFPLINFSAKSEGCSYGDQKFATTKGLWSSVYQQEWKCAEAVNLSRIQKWRASGVLLKSIPETAMEIRDNDVI